MRDACRTAAVGVAGAVLTVALASLTATVLPAQAPGSTYYVDFEDGSDDNEGTSPGTAFKHCPGDSGAQERAKETTLAPGDRVIFKGGVHYRGTVGIKASGTADAPLVFDGNTAGDFGRGAAVIDGGQPIAGWARCASAAEAGGNPQWQRIYRAVVPKSRYATWNSLNLGDEERSLPMAQEPNPSDPIFQENPADYYVVDAQLELDCPARIYPEEGTYVNRERPLVTMISPVRGSAVVDPVPGAGFSVEVPEPLTAVALGIAPQPGYSPVKTAAFLADGKEVLKANLEKDQREIQRFDLSAPVTFRKLTVKLLSMHEGAERSWTAIAKIAAYDADGNDRLNFPARSLLIDPKVLTQDDPRYFENARLATHAGRNMVHYQRILEYTPAEHRLAVEFFGGRQYDATKYAFFNSVRFIDRPGEWAVEPTEDEEGWRVFCMAPRVENGQPQGITCSQRGVGFSIDRASHVVIQGFRIMRQGNDRSRAGIQGRGPGEGILIKDCEVTMVNGTGITTTELDGVTVDGCHIHHNPGHSKGVVLRNAQDVCVQNCRLVKNTSTGLDYYTCHNGKFLNNTVLDHRGMHANGITIYLGSSNMLVEGNRVFGGHAAFTAQDGEDFLIRNNLFVSRYSVAFALWAGKPLQNVEVYNNTIVSGAHDVEWAASVYVGNTAGSGFVFKNNIVDGFSGTLPADTVTEYNLLTFRGPLHRDSEEGDVKARPLGKGEVLVDGIARVVADAENGDCRLRPDSPALDAGADLGDSVPTDIEGRKRPQGGGYDVGAYEGAAAQPR